jgi:hypothetical protein
VGLTVFSINYCHSNPKDEPCQNTTTHYKKIGLWRRFLNVTIHQKTVTNHLVSFILRRLLSVAAHRSGNFFHDASFLSAIWFSQDVSNLVLA